MHNSPFRCTLSSYKFHNNKMETVSMSYTISEHCSSSKMGTTFRFPLLLTLVLCSLFIEIAHGAPVIAIINSLPKDSPPLNLKCKTNVTDIDIGHPVNAGEVYTRNAKTNDLYFCIAMWGRYFAEFESFDPKRDAGHDKIIWKVEKDGFFLSYGNSTRWAKEVDWETD